MRAAGGWCRGLLAHGRRGSHGAASRRALHGARLPGRPRVRLDGRWGGPLLARRRSPGASAGWAVSIDHRRNGVRLPLRDDGTAVCWGQADFENADGQASPPADERFTSLSAGGSHTCALREDGRIRWGQRQRWAGIATHAGPLYVRSAAGGHTCALRDNGVVVCWGGTGSWHWKRLSEVSTRAGRFMSVSAGDAQTWAIREDGALLCWGSGAWPCNGWPPLGLSQAATTAGSRGRKQPRS